MKNSNEKIKETLKKIVSDWGTEEDMKEYFEEEKV